MMTSSVDATNSTFLLVVATIYTHDQVNIVMDPSPVANGYNCHLLSRL